ncbi:MAG: hypothetical protein ACK5SX_05835 [Sandaracinobacter sp.]
MAFANILFLVALAAVCGAAIVRGGQDERFAAFGVAAASFLSPIVTAHSYAGPELGLVLIDIGLFGILGWIALRSKAFWPIWTAGFQLCSLAGHLAAAKSQIMVPAAYAETLIIWSYAVMVALLMGTLLEGRRHHGRG